MAVLANILDPVQDTLDPTVWDAVHERTPVLKPQHKSWILETIHDVLKQHGYGDMDKWLEVYLTGSLTTYQYSDDSDADVSLFVNTDVFPEWSRAEMIGVMVSHLDGTPLPGTTHPMQGYVVAKGIRPEHLYKPGLRSGYEIQHDRWVVPPEHDRSHDVQREQNADYQYALEQADKMERLLRYEPNKAIQFWHQIHMRRMSDQKAGKGDFSQSNIIYKFLNNRGLFPQIEQASGEHIAQSRSASGEWMGGEWGKGLIDVDGNLHTWNTDRFGYPHHSDYSERLSPPIYNTPIVISPTGHFTQDKASLEGLEGAPNEPRRFHGRLGLKYIPDEDRWLRRYAAMTPAATPLPRSLDDHWLTWQPGTEGKGFILANGRVWHWPTENLRPMHLQRQYTVNKALKGKVRPETCFHIDPDGGVFQVGPGRHLEALDVARLNMADSRLHVINPPADAAGFGHGPDVYEKLKQSGAPAPWSIDHVAVDHAQQHMGLQRPVKINLVGGTHGRYHGPNSDGYHEIDLVHWLSPESASKQLWHEMTHALQNERDPNAWSQVTDNNQDQGFGHYRSHPEEIEAREVAESHPFPLVHGLRAHDLSPVTTNKGTHAGHQAEEQPVIATSAQ